MLEDEFQSSHEAIELIHLAEDDPQALGEEVGELVCPSTCAPHTVDVVVEPMADNNEEERFAILRA